MTINDLVTALQPLEGWLISANGPRFAETRAFLCHAVRKLEPRERRGKGNVILASTPAPVFDMIYGMAFHAKNIVSVTWLNNRVRLVAKDGQVGHIRRVRPIERGKPERGLE